MLSRNMAHFLNAEFAHGFYYSHGRGLTAVEFQRESLQELSHDLERIQSHTICLYYLAHSTEYCQKCHHALCNNCMQIFRKPAMDAKYQFIVTICILCLSRERLVINILPPTMDPSVLVIDRGGVYKESLGLDYKLHKLVDLTVGTSSGSLIILGLSSMEWDAITCSYIFNYLACWIFYKYRESMLLHLVSWFFHDSCYDSKVFEESLREAFYDNLPIFGPAPDGSRSHSNSKFVVITTNIIKETKSFVFSNFNMADWFAEYHVFRGERGQEPLFWEV
ncbi:hypothetical protein BDV06DRAFT_217099 [Aspergillus oleicola]